MRRYFIEIIREFSLKIYQEYWLLLR